MKQITVKFLFDNKACTPQVLLFNRLFGESMEVETTNVYFAMSNGLKTVWLGELLSALNFRNIDVTGKYIDYCHAAGEIQTKIYAVEKTHRDRVRRMSFERMVEESKEVIRITDRYLLEKAELFTAFLLCVPDDDSGIPEND